MKKKHRGPEEATRPAPFERWDDFVIRIRNERGDPSLEIHVSIGLDAPRLIDPGVAALAGRVICGWNFVELSIAHLAQCFMSGDLAATSDFVTEIRDPDARRRALKSAATSAGCLPQDVDLLGKVIKLANKVYRRRNEYAHEIWACSPQATDHVVLIEKSAFARSLALEVKRIRESNAMSFVWPDTSFSSEMRGRTQADHAFGGMKVFSEAAIKEDLQAVAYAHRAVDALSYVLLDRPERDMRRNCLLEMLPDQTRREWEREHSKAGHACFLAPGPLVGYLAAFALAALLSLPRTAAGRWSTASTFSPGICSRRSARPSK